MQVSVIVQSPKDESDGAPPTSRRRCIRLKNQVDCLTAGATTSGAPSACFAKEGASILGKVKISGMPSQAQASSPSPPSTLSFEAIERARAVLEARAQAAAAGDWIDDYEDVVVASNVSASELREVPEDWLSGIELVMRPDGVVIAIHRASQAHDTARSEVARQVGVYASSNAGMRTFITPQLQLGGGRNARPDVALLMRNQNVPPPGNLAAIALFEIEHNGRSGPDMIRTAAQHLTHLPTVECVVFLTLLSACAQLPDRPNDLRVPALALVFHRGQGTLRRRNGQDIQRVRVTQSRSFGNVGIPRDELTCFTRLRASSLLEEPITGVDALVDHEQVGLFPGPLDMMNLDMSLAQARTRAREIAQERLDDGAALDAVEFRIPMPAPLAAIPVDLIDVFYEMMLGSDFDREVAARDAAARAPVVGVEVADAADESPATQVDADVDMDAGAEAARDNDQ